MSTGKANDQYEVLSPWADADSIPRKGITPRLTNLEGKTIGLFENQKVSAKPTLTAVEKQLKERFPTCKFSWFVSPQDIGPASGPPKQLIDSKHKAEFEEWLKGVDTVVAAVGD
jgi:hypothetical protein